MIVYAGVDIGTGGVRAVSLTDRLDVLAEEERSYSVEAPESGWAEQDPERVASATIDSMSKLAERHPGDEVVFCLSSVMHSLIAVDRAGRPVSPMLIWADNRAIRETKWLEREYGTALFYDSTACPLHPSFWPGKIIWLGREIGPRRISRYVSIKEYLLFKLTGEWIVDASVAGSSGLFDLRASEFDPDLLDALRISREALSSPVPTTHALQVEIGGRERTLIVGSTDGVLANLGIGAVDSATAVVTVGSSAAVRVTYPEPVFDSERRAWCYPLDEEHYVVGEASNSGGLVLNWLARLLSYDTAAHMTSEILPTAPYEPIDALLLPTLSGERAPGYQEELRGELIDLALNTTRADLVAAAVEGIGLFCRLIYDDVVRATGKNPPTTILTGGLGRSRALTQLAPLLFGPCFTRPEMDRSSAVGAAMLALKAHEGLEYREIVCRLPELEPVEALRSKEFGAYLDEKYERFKDAYRVASSRIKAVAPAGPDDARGGGAS